MSENQNENTNSSPRAKTPNDIIIKKFAHHPETTFNELVFIDLLEHSLSLSVFEKKRVIDNIPLLSQFQIDELIKVFEDERVEFRKLVSTEWEIIKWLVIKAQNEWEELKDIYADEEAQNAQLTEDLKKAEELKKNLWI